MLFGKVDFKDEKKSLKDVKEDIIKTFYNETLKNEYGYKGLSLNVPGHDLSWLEKVRALIPEIESIVRQYNLYLAEGEIDPEVLELTDAIKITDCGSMIPNKYQDKYPEQHCLQPSKLYQDRMFC